MHREDLVVRTKLTPPRLHKHTLHRPRVTRRLLEVLDYRLAIVQAGTGYGKSTALAALADREHPPTWYHLGAQDADSLVLLEAYRSTPARHGCWQPAYGLMITVYAKRGL